MLCDRSSRCLCETKHGILQRVPLLAQLGLRIHEPGRVPSLPAPDGDQARERPRRPIDGNRAPRGRRLALDGSRRLVRRIPAPPDPARLLDCGVRSARRRQGARNLIDLSQYEGPLQWTRTFYNPCSMQEFSMCRKARNTFARSVLPFPV